MSCPFFLISKDYSFIFTCKSNRIAMQFLISEVATIATLNFIRAMWNNLTLIPFHGQKSCVPRKRKTGSKISSTWNQIEFVRDLSLYWKLKLNFFPPSFMALLVLQLAHTRTHASTKGMNGQTDGGIECGFHFDDFSYVRLNNIHSVFGISMKFMNSITCRNEMKSQFKRCGIQWSKSMIHRTFTICEERERVKESCITFMEIENARNIVMRDRKSHRRRWVFFSPATSPSTYLVAWSVNVFDSSEWFFLL